MLRLDLRSRDRKTAADNPCARSGNFVAMLRHKSKVGVGCAIVDAGSTVERDGLLCACGSPVAQCSFTAHEGVRSLQLITLGNCIPE